MRQFSFSIGLPTTIGTKIDLISLVVGNTNTKKSTIKDQNKILEFSTMSDYLRLVLNIMNNPAFLLNESKVVATNAAAKKLFKTDVSIEEPIYFPDLFSKNKLDYLAVYNLFSIDSPDIFNKQFTLMDKDENYIYTSSFSSISEGNNNFLICEITEAKTLNKNKEIPTEQISELILRNSNLPNALIDSTGEIIKCNDDFKNLFGFNEDYLISPAFLKYNCDLSALLSSHYATESMTHTCIAYNFGTVIRDNLKRNIFVDIQLIPIKDSQYFVLLFNDRTAEKNLLLSLRNAEDKAKTLKSIFLAQMSHEIRTPINAILSFANLIKEEVKDKIPAELQSGFEVINRGGERVIRTINLILDLSEIMTNSYEYMPKELDIYTDIFSEVFLKYQKLARSKELECTYEVHQTGGVIYGDEYMIKQILSNIMDNAVKFTSDGDIKASLFTNQDGYITIEVKDSGIGMAEDYLEKVFEPFTQEDEGTTRRYEGNGVGLTLTKSYCDLNGVDISIISHKTVGTTIRLVFKQTVGSMKIPSSDSNKKVRIAGSDKY